MQRLVDIAPPEVHAVWDLLGAIPDPEVPVLTITDLGLVRSVERRGDGWVIGFTPTYSGCPYHRTSTGRNPRGNDGKRLRAGAYRAAA